MEGRKFWLPGAAQGPGNRKPWAGRKPWRPRAPDAAGGCQQEAPRAEPAQHSGLRGGTAPRLPRGGRLKPRPVAPEPHGLPGPQDTCPQAVARQEDSHVLGQCHQVSRAVLGLGAREVAPAQHL